MQQVKSNQVYISLINCNIFEGTKNDFFERLVNLEAGLRKKLQDLRTSHQFFYNCTKSPQICPDCENLSIPKCVTG